jgi:hypothetical protein
VKKACAERAVVRAGEGCAMGWLWRKRDSTALDRACRVGFIVASDSLSSSLRQFEAWCRENDRPLIWIRPFARSADILLDMGMCSWNLANDSLEELEVLLNMTSPHRGARVGKACVRIYGVPSALSEVLAFRVFELAMERRPEPVIPCGQAVG